jgi:D-alanyl-D-alanine carboxypeptidase
MNGLIDSLKCFLLLLSLLLPSIAFNQSPMEKEVTSVIEEHVQANDFSGTILVAKQGKPFFHQSYGLAELSTEERIQNHDHYSIASITKLFTAIRILQLVDSDQLDLSRSLIDYLPELQGLIAAEITPHHLLLHTSGLPTEKGSFYLQPMTLETLVKKSLAGKSTNTLNSFKYNNIDYHLLGMLIEQIGGQSWEKQIPRPYSHPT